MTTVLPRDHSGLEVMPEEECIHRLARSRVGRVAFLLDGYPIILPVNHGVDGHSVVFRTNDGSKLMAAQDELSVAFEVDGFDADRQAGWSVLVRGVATTIDDPEEISQLNLAGIRPWADASRRRHWVRIRTHEISGRHIVRRPLA